MEKGASRLADWDETPVYYGMSRSSTYHLRLFKLVNLNKKAMVNVLGDCEKTFI